MRHAAWLAVLVPALGCEPGGEVEVPAWSRALPGTTVVVLDPVDDELPAGHTDRLGATLSTLGIEPLPAEAGRPHAWHLPAGSAGWRTLGDSAPFREARQRPPQGTTWLFVDCQQLVDALPRTDSRLLAPLLDALPLEGVRYLVARRSGGTVAQPHVDAFLGADGWPAELLAAATPGPRLLARTDGDRAAVDAVLDRATVAASLRRMSDRGGVFDASPFALASGLLQQLAQLADEAWTGDFAARVRGDRDAVLAFGVRDEDLAFDLLGRMFPESGADGFELPGGAFARLAGGRLVVMPAAAPMPAAGRGWDRAGVDLVLRDARAVLAFLLAPAAGGIAARLRVEAPR